jgi:hypothetical protein
MAKVLGTVHMLGRGFLLGCWWPEHTKLTTGNMLLCEMGTGLMGLLVIRICQWHEKNSYRKPVNYNLKRKLYGIKHM